jgi:hypothetical protein
MLVASQRCPGEKGLEGRKQCTSWDEDQHGKNNLEHPPHADQHSRRNAGRKAARPA